ncbi:MAG: undecaprenyl-diphosphate phosphatase [Clostridia bacterium]|nr:undecaprenyl-diphosphate phosphatase [Clostridia bacterium]
MANFIETLKVLFLGIVEGITEWLPISSTGHMLLVDEFLQMKESAEFKELFFIVIQLGAILAVILLFWERLFPFELRKKAEGGIKIKKNIMNMWGKVVLACIPGAAAVFLFDDYIEAHFETPTVIALALILYGIAFLIIEKKNADSPGKITSVDEISYKNAFLIGLFQVLSIIPGTSRSGSTIIGARLLGISRVAAAEFTFFLAVPVMAGYSLLKLLKFGFDFTGAQLLLLGIGCLSAFITSYFCIKFLMDYVKKHSFAAFGWYRIALGAVVLAYFHLFPLIF